jgi:hypothetical protein
MALCLVKHMIRLTVWCLVKHRIGHDVVFTEAQDTSSWCGTYLSRGTYLLLTES